MKTSLKLVLIFFLVIITSYYFESDRLIQATALNRAESPTKFGSVAPVVKCDTSAYIIDKDPNGTNVRSKPDKSSPIIKTLKSEDAIVVSISGSSGGWFQISFAETAGGETDQTLFKGRGWIHSSLLGIDVAAGEPKLYAEPRKTSRVLQKLIPDGSQISPIGCKSDWMQVRSGKLTGWVPREAQCANPLTTCA
jgi:SH3-like domain-containing protein